MSLIPIAIHKNQGSLVNIDPNYEVNTNDQEYEYSTPNDTLEILPSVKNDDRDTFFIGGSPGSGKTYYTVQYILRYMQSHPGNRVFVFTPKPDDKSLDPLKGKRGVQIINLNAKDPDGQYYFMTHYAGKDSSFFKNSLVFIDDRVGVLDKDVKKALDVLDEQLLKVGREYNVFLIITHHEITDHRFTRDFLANTKYVVAFPKGGGHKILMNYLKNYLYLKPHQIDDLLSKNSRWLTFKQTIPQFVLHEHGLKMI